MRRAWRSIVISTHLWRPWSSSFCASILAFMVSFLILIFWSNTPRTIQYYLYLLVVLVRIDPDLDLVTYSVHIHTAYPYYNNYAGHFGRGTHWHVTPGTPNYTMRACSFMIECSHFAFPLAKGKHSKFSRCRYFYAVLDHFTNLTPRSLKKMIILPTLATSLIHVGRMYLLTLSLPSSQKVHSPNLLKRKCISEVVRIGSAIIFHLSELWKAKFSILCDVLLLVRLQEKFDIDHSWEWKG